MSIKEIAEKFPIGTWVKLSGWPVGGQVIGYDENAVIIEPKPMRMDISDVQIDDDGGWI